MAKITEGSSAVKMKLLSNVESTQRTKVETYKPQYKMIKLDSLCIDKYQRALTYADCKRYRKDFDWYLVGVLLVSHRDGNYFIVDGQHRKVLLQMMGVQETLCQVIDGLTYEEEAALFKKYNTCRKSLGRADLLVADIEAGDKRALDIIEVVHKSPYACERNKQDEDAKGKINIHAVAALENAYDSLGAKGLGMMLDLIHQTWPGEKSAVNGRMIAGMACFSKHYPLSELDIKNFVSKVGAETPVNIFRQAFLDEKYSPTSGNKGVAIARVILKLYNNHLRSNSKLPYKF